MAMLMFGFSTYVVVTVVLHDWEANKYHFKTHVEDYTWLALKDNSMEC